MPLYAKKILGAGFIRYINHDSCFHGAHSLMRYQIMNPYFSEWKVL